MTVRREDEPEIEYEIEEEDLGPSNKAKSMLKNEMQAVSGRSSSKKKKVKWLYDRYWFLFIHLLPELFDIAIIFHKLLTV